MQATATKAAAQTDNGQSEKVAKKTAVPESPEQSPLWADAVIPAIQFKLKINTPNDPFEQEADRVAEQVMRMPDTAVQRKTCACGKPMGEGGMCEDCQRKQLSIQRKVNGNGAGTAAPPIVNQVLSQPGRPLDNPTRNYMESRFGRDFGSVRVHTNAMAAESAQTINARAFTTGRNIVFGSGEYTPSSLEGKKLLAHELTHTIQQSQGIWSQTIQRKSSVTSVDTCPKAAFIKRTKMGIINEPNKVIAYSVNGVPKYDGDKGQPGKDLDNKDIELEPGTKVFLGQSGKEKTRFENYTAICLKIGKRNEVHWIKMNSWHYEPDEIPEGAYDEDVGECKVGGKCEVPISTPAPATSATGDLDIEGPGWSNVNKPGIAFMEGPKGKGGANLRAGLTTNSKLIKWLPQNTHVYILKQNKEAKRYAVAVLDGSGGTFGYVADWLIAKNLPDPEATIYKVKSGETALGIAFRAYKGKGFNAKGKDKRYVVNALSWVNKRFTHNIEGGPGIVKENDESPWDDTKAYAGAYTWLPSPAHMNMIYETVVKHGGGTGSITADLWRGIKTVGEYAAYALAFVGGLIHGFVKSLYDAVVGLVGSVLDILVSIFKRTIIKDAKDLWDSLSKMTWKDFKEALSNWADEWERKLNSDSPWVAGHTHGFLTGYIMAEAAQLLITAGQIAALKAAIWGTRIGKAIKTTSAFQKFSNAIVKSEKIVDATVKGEKLTAALSKLNKARNWAKTTFKLTAYTLKDLGIEAIEKLKKIPTWAHERIRNMSAAAKRALLGCSSACKVNIDKIMEVLRIPQGFSPHKWKKFSKGARRLAREAKLPKGELAVHGSRATGLAKATSDIDIILRVDEKIFFEFAHARISSVKAGTKLHKTLLKAARKGKLSRFDISPDFNKLLREYLIPHSPYDVDFSIIKKGSAFDTEPFIPLGKF